MPTEPYPFRATARMAQDFPALIRDALPEWQRRGLNFTARCQLVAAWLGSLPTPLAHYYVQSGITSPAPGQLVETVRAGLVGDDAMLGLKLGAAVEARCWPEVEKLLQAAALEVSRG